jgi:hypothetical protein
MMVDALEVDSLEVHALAVDPLAIYHALVICCWDDDYSAEVTIIRTLTFMDRLCTAIMEDTVDMDIITKSVSDAFHTRKHVVIINSCDELIFCRSCRQISEEKIIWYISNSNFRCDF